MTGRSAPAAEPQLASRPTSVQFFFVSRDGKPVNKQVLNLVAEPVGITGEVERQGELLILRTEPATYRRIAK